MPKSRRTNDLDLWKCTSLGLELAVALGLGAFAGHLADKWLDSHPLLLVIGCLLGLAAGMVRIVRTVSMLQARGTGPDAAGPPPAGGNAGPRRGDEEP